MEIHLQHCQECGSDQVRNILYRQPGEPDRVIVQCTQCEHFVASYIIAPLGYYHHGKGFESFVRGLHRSGEFMSGRKVQALFESRKEKETRLFDKVVALLRERKG